MRVSAPGERIYIGGELGGASCGVSVRCRCVSEPVFSFYGYSLHVINIFTLLVQYLTGSEVR